MTTTSVVLWIVLPYVSLTLFVAGHVWRYRRDQFGWTCRSTQLLERRLLAWGSVLFHFGALAAIGGHVVGMLIPASVTSALGISESMYHGLSAVAGGVAGVGCVAGLIVLLYRRLTVRRVRVTTTRSDTVMCVLLTAIIALGVVETIGVNGFGGGYDYRATIGVWFRSIFVFHPRTDLMDNASLIYQVHATLAWLLLAIWPFTRLVHAWSIPAQYLGRPYILYRRRFARAH
jgi:nitrate reductase gamma subunit